MNPVLMETNPPSPKKILKTVTVYRLRWSYINISIHCIPLDRKQKQREKKNNNHYKTPQKVCYDHWQSTTCTRSTITVTAQPFFSMAKRKKSLHTLIHEHIPTHLNPRAHTRVCRISPHWKHIPRRRLPSTSPKEGLKSSTSPWITQSKTGAQSRPLHPKTQGQLKTLILQMVPSLSQRGTSHNSPAGHPKGRGHQHQRTSLIRSTCSFILITQDRGVGQAQKSNFFFSTKTDSSWSRLSCFNNKEGVRFVIFTPHTPPQP